MSLPTSRNTASNFHCWENHCHPRRHACHFWHTHAGSPPLSLGVQQQQRLQQLQQLSTVTVSSSARNDNVKKVTTLRRSSVSHCHTQTTSTSIPGGLGRVQRYESFHRLSDAASTPVPVRSLHGSSKAESLRTVSRLRKMPWSRRHGPHKQIGDMGKLIA
jgi:hypothetical protein